MSTTDDPTTNRPLFLVISSDAAALNSVAGDLERRYSADYEVARAGSAQRAAEISGQLAIDGRTVALVLSSLILSDSDGAEALALVRAQHPGSLRVFLLQPGNREEAEMVQRPLQMGLAEHYLLVPMVAPDEGFHAGISELLAEWARAHQAVLEVAQMVGKTRSQRTHELRDLLARNGLPIGFHDVDTDEGRQILRDAGTDDSALPVVVTYNGTVLRDPTTTELADAFTGGDTPDWTTFDVAVIGGGPAGLAASVSAASEGLQCFVLDHAAMGGQAGTTSRIRNYLGFPRGISGQELAQRAFDQAWTFSVAFQFARSAESIDRTDDCFVIGLSDGIEVKARSVVLAPGADYRRLDVPELEAMVGVGVYYGAAVTEAESMRDREVFVVGGGNSAGQAAVHLSRFAKQVTMVVRNSSLAISMSDYLIREIHVRDNITILTNTRVVSGGGAESLEFVELLNDMGELERHEAGGLFVLIGAEPRTEWLPDSILRDEWGYVMTGPEVQASGRWALERPPLLYETSVPGVFAVGDVRNGSVKRIASAVGEGSVVIQGIHRYLQDP